MSIESVKLKASSTMIKEISYHYALEKLTVRFNNDSVYIYDGVPSDVIAQLQQASSTGEAFNALVRHRYNYHKVKTSEIPVGEKEISQTTQE